MFNIQTWTAVFQALLSAGQKTTHHVTVLPSAPRRKTSRNYHDGHEGERMRRWLQIQAGTLRTDNGLVHRGQLISKPDGTLRLRWQ